MDFSRDAHGSGDDGTNPERAADFAIDASVDFGVVAAQKLSGLHALSRRSPIPSCRRAPTGGASGPELARHIMKSRIGVGERDRGTGGANQVWARSAIK